MTYDQAIETLYAAAPMFQQIGAAAYKANLDNTRALDERFGHPHRKFRSVHIAGTNGKGSTSHITASVLQRAGYKVGLFTSPHLSDFRERIRINGQTMPQDEVAAFVGRHLPLIERVRPSFFEITFIMAVDWFARQGVDIAVLETGMGGRLDSTNIVTPLASVITNIGYDHTQFLGGTLEEIAGEKAGIIKPGVPVVIGESDPETAPVFMAAASIAGAPIRFADKEYRCVGGEIRNGGREYACKSAEGGETLLRCDLAGDYQQKNIPTVLALIDVLRSCGVDVPENAVREGFETAAAATGLLGRWQKLSEHPLVVCDTGHNEAGIRDVMAQITRQRCTRLFMVLGVVSDKDLSKILPLLPKRAWYIFTKPSLPRAKDEAALAAEAAAYGLQGETRPAVALAYTRACELASPDDMVFVGGSSFVVADLLSMLNE